MPRTIQVGAHTYKVAQKRHSKLLGNCNYDDQILGMRPGMVRSKAQEVLLHEVLHACGYPSLCGKDEEVVDAIAPMLLQVIRQNPKLIDYLRS